MTGDQHYRESERLLEVAKEMADHERLDPSKARILATAQVHATLALAAAVAAPRTQLVGAAMGMLGGGQAGRT